MKPVNPVKSAPFVRRRGRGGYDAMPRTVVHDPQLGELELADALMYLYLDALTCAVCGRGADYIVGTGRRRGEPWCWRCLWPGERARP